MEACVKNPKQEVRCRAFCDGKQANERVERRVVYTRKDGSLYIRDSLKGQITLHPDPDGMLAYELHARTVRVMTWQDFSRQVGDMP